MFSYNVAHIGGVLGSLEYVHFCTQFYWLALLAWILQKQKYIFVLSKLPSEALFLNFIESIVVFSGPW